VTASRWGWSHGGSARTTERGTLTVDYTRSADDWAIVEIAFQPV